MIHLLSVLINVMEVEILLMIHMLKYVFQIKQKNMNAKVFNLMSWVNKTRFIVQHKLCESKCGLN